MGPTCFTANQVFIEGDFQRGAYLQVDDGVIRAVGEMPPEGSALVDFGEAAIFPGLVNTHTHSHLSLLRGLLDGMEIGEWLKAVYGAVARFGVEESYLGGALAYSEALLSGTTTIADFFYLNGRGNDNIKATIRAATDLGIRLVMGRTFLDAEWGGPATRETVAEAVRRFRDLRQEYEGNDLVEICPAPHSLHGASRAMVEAACSLAREHNTQWYMHVGYSKESAEGVEGEKSIPLLGRWGVLDDQLVNVHATWLLESELDMLGARRGKVSTCPASNMIFGERMIDIPGFKRRGIRVGLGTDGAASNNTQDLFSEMRIASLGQRLAAERADAVTAEEIIDLGTSSGGEVLALPVGKLAPGYKADFIVVDTADVALQPPAGLLSHMVHSMTARAVRHVYVGGRPAVRDRRLVNVELEEIIARLGRLGNPVHAADEPGRR